MRRAKPRKPVVVFGDINVDIFARLPSFPAEGEDCLMPELQMLSGGVGANTAVALARWGIPVRLFGAVGRDAFGDHVLDFLRREQVDVSPVARLKRPMTGVMFVAVSPNGQRTFLGSRGANAEPAAPSADAACVDGARAVYLVGYSFLSAAGANAAERVLGQARGAGACVALDVGQSPSREASGKILQLAGKVDILFVTLGEARALTGERDLSGALAALEACGAHEVVLKRGERGCLVRDGAALREVPAFRVLVVDTTGAGDAFAAAYLRARLANWPSTEAALLANAAGAAAAAVLGAGENIPGPRHILAVLEAARLDSCWEPLRVRLIERLRRESRGSAGS